MRQYVIILHGFGEIPRRQFSRGPAVHAVAAAALPFACHSMNALLNPLPALSHPTRSASTFSLSLALPRSPAALTSAAKRPQNTSIEYHRNSFRITSFADPSHISLLESHLFEKQGGGVRPRILGPHSLASAKLFSINNLRTLQTTKPVPYPEYFRAHAHLCTACFRLLRFSP